MRSAKLSEVCSTIKETVNPQKYPDRFFTHYSIPSFDEDETPEYISGIEIKSSKLVLNKPCLLFSRLNPRIKRIWDLTQINLSDSSIGSTEWVPFVINDENELNSRYLYWYLHTERFISIARAGVKAATKSRERVKKESLFEVKIPLPPLAEQRRIAAVLDKAAELRALRQRAIDKLDALLQSVFLDMFGDPVTNPKGWDKMKLGDLVAIDAPTVDPTLPEFRLLKHIGGDRIEKNTGRLLPAKTAEEDKLISIKFLFDESYILYSKIRPYLRKVAMPDFEGLCSADIYPVRPKNGLISKEILFHILISKSFTDFTEEFSNRANIPKINRKQFLSFDCYVPPSDIQHKFTRIQEGIKSQMKPFVKFHLNADELFKSIQAKAFHGNII